MTTPERTEQERTLQSFLEAVVGPGTPYGAEVIFSHPDAPEPCLPFIRLEVGGGTQIGTDEAYVNGDCETVTQGFRQASVTLEVVGQTAQSIMAEIDSRIRLDYEADRRLSKGNVEVGDFRDLGVNRVRLETSWDIRGFVAMLINYRQKKVRPLGSPGALGVVNGVRASGDLEGQEIEIEAPA